MTRGFSNGDSESVKLTIIINHCKKPLSHFSPYIFMKDLLLRLSFLVLDVFIVTLTFKYNIIIVMPVYFLCFLPF